MLMSQFSAVERPLTLAPSGAVTPTRLAIGAISRAIDGQSTMPKRVLLGQAQHDVFQDVHARHKRQFLVNEAHAQFIGVMWCFRDNALTLDENFPAIRLG